MGTVILSLICNGCGTIFSTEFELNEADAHGLAVRMAHADIVPEMEAMRTAMHAAGWTSTPAEPVYSFQRLAWDEGEKPTYAELPFTAAKLDFCPACSAKERSN